MSQRGPLLVLGAATLWGTTGTAQALGPEGINPETVALVRMVGGSLLLIYSVFRGTNSPIRGLPRPALIMAVAAMAGSQPLFFGGVERTGVAIGTIVTIGSGPLLAGALAWLVRREPVTRRWYIATAVSIGGSLVLVSGGESAGVDGLGLLLALGAGVAWLAWIGSDPLADRHALLIVVFPLLVYVTYAFYGGVRIKSPCDGDRKK